MRLPCSFFMYLYLTWAGSMDKMFCTYFLFFFSPWTKAAIKCRRSEAMGTCCVCHTRAVQYSLTGDKHPVSRARAATWWKSFVCTSVPLSSGREKRAVLCFFSGLFALLSREHPPLLWWKQGQRWRMVRPARPVWGNPTGLWENVWKSPPDFYQLRGKGE